MVLARFYYEPDIGVCPFLDVVAHIFARKLGTTKADIAQLHKTVWRKNETREARFHTAEDHELVVALLPTDSSPGLVLYEYDDKPYEFGYGTHLSPILRQCNGEEFLFRVQLVGKWTDDSVRYNRQFEMPLKLLPATLGAIRLLPESDSLRG